MRKHPRKNSLLKGLSLCHTIPKAMCDLHHGYCAANIDRSVKNHLIGFAAEKARHEETVEKLDQYFETFGMKND